MIRRERILKFAFF